MRFSVSYAEINQVLLFVIRFLIFLQTRQLCAVLGGDPKTAIADNGNATRLPYWFIEKNVKT